MSFGGADCRVVEGSSYVSTASWLIGSEIAAAARSGSASIALSGGSTPGPVYRELASDPRIEWKKVDVFLADERAVPPDDPASNFRLVQEILVGNLGPERAPRAVHPMFVVLDGGGTVGSAPSLGKMARMYGDLLPVALDVLILGIGSDGHTASLFPGTDSLRATGKAAVSEAPVHPRQRLTIGPSVIAGARRIFVLARGSGKQQALECALLGGGDVNTCPARLARCPAAIWVLDDVAGGFLRELGPG